MTPAKTKGENTSMQTVFRRTILAIGAATLCMLGAAPIQAAASGPVVFDVNLTRQGLFENCGTFKVSFVAHITAQYEQFFNDSGQLILERRHVQFDGTLTNTITGMSIPYEGNFIRTQDASTSTVTLVGLRRKTEIPGQGVLAIAAGRLVIDTHTGAVLSETGQTDENYNAAVCRLLG